MNEAQVTTELTNMLKGLRVYPFKVPDSFARDPGLPDIICLDAPFVIEVKMFNAARRPQTRWGVANFPFSHISHDQRLWLSLWCAQPLSRYDREAYLALGTRHGTAGAERNPRMLWLIPWGEWLAIEKKVRPHRKSLPLAARVRARDPKLTALYLLESWALKWAAGKWIVPLRHPFMYKLPSVFAREIQ